MAERRLYCVVAMPTRIEFQGMPGGELVPVPATPTVVGPFKTLVQARKAGEADWGGSSDVRWMVVPLFGYSDTAENKISLVYDRLMDPGLRKRCFACKQSIKEGGEKDAA